MTNDELIIRARKEIQNKNSLYECIKVIYNLWLNLDVSGEVYDYKEDEKLYDGWLYDGESLELAKIQFGLCRFVNIFCGKYIDNLIKSWEIEVIHNGMLLMAHLNTDFPFGEEEYKEEYKSKTSHLNPNRISWVKSIISMNLEEFLYSHYDEC